MTTIEQFWQYFDESYLPYKDKVEQYESIFEDFCEEYELTEKESVKLEKELNK